MGHEYDIPNKTGSFRSMTTPLAYRVFISLYEQNLDLYIYYEGIYPYPSSHFMDVQQNQLPRL